MRHNVGYINKLMRNSGGQPVYKAFSGNCPGSSPGALGKGRNGKKGPSLSGGAGEKARFRDGASNRLAGKLAEIREKVKRRQNPGNFWAFPVSKENKACRSRGNEGQWTGSLPVTGTSTHANAITGKARKKPGEERCCHPNYANSNGRPKRPYL